jgi:hypothetical protein
MTLCILQFFSSGRAIPGILGSPGSRAAQTRSGTRARARTATAAVGAAMLLASTGIGRAAESGKLLHLRCTNPVSGANWQVVVDLARQRVDSLPAEISDSWISWHDPAGGFFDLERATGRLRVRIASSTGGYSSYDTCRSE